MIAHREAKLYNSTSACNALKCMTIASSFFFFFVFFLCSRSTVCGDRLTKAEVLWFCLLHSLTVFCFVVFTRFRAPTFYLSSTFNLSVTLSLSNGKIQNHFALIFVVVSNQVKPNVIACMRKVSV